MKKLIIILFIIILPQKMKDILKTHKLSLYSKIDSERGGESSPPIQITHFNIKYH